MGNPLQVENMGPLRGIKVVEMGIWIAGPAAGAVLGDWGAEVLKIENPAGGDPVRGLSGNRPAQADWGSRPTSLQNRRCG
jgi:crotonobetainyl-CoA:carnitine CoA-transferase CaiB-like acyl-CoA transferase